MPIRKTPRIKQSPQEKREESYDRLWNGFLKEYSQSELEKVQTQEDLQRLLAQWLSQDTLEVGVRKSSALIDPIMQREGAELIAKNREKLEPVQIKRPKSKYAQKVARRPIQRAKKVKLKIKKGQVRHFTILTKNLTKYKHLGNGVYKKKKKR